MKINKQLCTALVMLGFLGLGGYKANAAIDETVKNIDIDMYYQKDRIQIDFKQDKTGKVKKASLRNDLKNQKFAKTLGEVEIREMFEDVDFKYATNNDILMAVLQKAEAPEGAEFTHMSFKGNFWDSKKSITFTDKEVLNAGEVINNKDLVDLKATVTFNKKKVNLSYKVGSKKISASYKNALTDEKYRDLQASAKISSLFKYVNLRTASNNDIVEGMLNSLSDGTTELQPTKIELKAKFVNGSTRSFNFIPQVVTPEVTPDSEVTPNN